MDSAKRPPVSLNSARADCQEPIEILTKCGMTGHGMPYSSRLAAEPGEGVVP
jgi:hypothetical protein